MSVLFFQLQFSVFLTLLANCICNIIINKILLIVLFLIAKKYDGSIPETSRVSKIIAWLQNQL